MFIILVSTCIILILSILMLGVQILLKKGGQFPNTHVGGNSLLKEKGVFCAKTQDWQAANHQNLFERLKNDRSS